MEALGDNRPSSQSKTVLVITSLSRLARDCATSSRPIAIGMWDTSHLLRFRFSSC